MFWNECEGVWDTGVCPVGGWERVSWVNGRMFAVSVKAFVEKVFGVRVDVSTGVQGCLGGVWGCFCFCFVVVVVVVWGSKAFGVGEMSPWPLMILYLRVALVLVTRWFHCTGAKVTFTENAPGNPQGHTHILFLFFVVKGLCHWGSLEV